MLLSNHFSTFSLALLQNAFTLPDIFFRVIDQSMQDLFQSWVSDRHGGNSHSYFVTGRFPGDLALLQALENGIRSVLFEP